MAEPIKAAAQCETEGRSEAMNETTTLDELLHGWSEQADNLILILQELQAKFRYLPQPALREVSKRLQVPLTEVFQVATFYNCFSLEPVGNHLVQVCLGTACHVRGAPQVLDRLLRELKLTEPGTTKDCEFTVRPVRCIGCCGLAPVIRVDSRTHAHMAQTKVRGMLKQYQASVPAAQPMERN
jgi:NADH-quinone oxidoreductase subunit E